jgi:uncharacterized protein
LAQENSCFSLTDWESDSQSVKEKVYICAMIERNLSTYLLALAKQYPVVSVSGPRQSGKTTLVRHLFPHLTYVNLEDIELRTLAELDPKQFLSRYAGGLIIDEVQYVPSLFSYIQLEADMRQRMGEFVLTGSQNFLLMEQISQSLAGRVALFHLLPFSVPELKQTIFEEHEYLEYLFNGMYPGLYERGIDAAHFYPNYIQTYIERDVRQLVNVQDLSKFRLFTELCAARVGQLWNQSAIANELNINHKTADRWLSILETSFIAFRLRPFHKNYNKRITKTPKLYFYDTGVICSLLGIRNRQQLELHPLKGQIFENFIVVETLKYFQNKGIRPNMYFWRDQTGNEVDLLLDDGGVLYPMEIKSAQTFRPDFFKSLHFFSKISGCSAKNSYLIYGGTQNLDSANGNICAWNNLPEW